MSNGAPRAVSLDPLTTIPLYIEPFIEGATLRAQATGFIVSEGNAHFLITNWHVVTGLHPETNQPLSGTTGLVNPNVMAVWMYERGLTGQWFEVRVPLRDENDRPLWLEHPRGSTVDVVALPVPQLTELNARTPGGYELEIYPLSMTLADTDMMVRPSEPVSIVGFPGGITVDGKLPIWKTGHVASDIELNYAGAPRFLVDATTGTGMSGSPVVARRFGAYRLRNGQPTVDLEANRFMGIYSGRVGTRLPDVPIGIVWKPDVIRDILRAAEPA